MDVNLEQSLAQALAKARDLEAIVNHSRSVVMRAELPIFQLNT